MEQERQEVTWMPVVPGFALGLVLTALLFVAGSVLAGLALIGLVVRLARRQGGLLTWCCVGILLGYAVTWALIGLHALF